MTTPTLSVLDLVPGRAATRPPATRSPRPVALAQVADELGYRRYWLAEHHNMPAVAATNPPVLIAHGRRGHRADPGRLRRRDAAQPRAAGRRRAVRAARGRLPGPDRPRHRPRARHRPGHQLGAAPRRRRSRATRRSSRFPEYVDNVRRDDDARRASGCRSRAATPRAAAPPRTPCRVPTVWLLGLLGLLGRAWPPRRGCPTSSPTTSRARARPRRSRSTARVPALAGAPRAAHVPTVNAVVAPTRGGGGPAGAARSCSRWWRCAPGSRCTAQRLVEEAEEVEVARRAPRLLDAMRSPLGDRATRSRRAPGSRELAATYDVDEVMVHPVAGAHDGTDAPHVPGPRGDAAPARSLTGLGILRPKATKLACRPNVGLFRGASRLPGSLLDRSQERVGRVPGTRSRRRPHEVHRMHPTPDGSRVER